MVLEVRDSLVLGCGSHEGLHREWCWVIWGWIWIWEMLEEALGVLCGQFITGFSRLERAEF